jgi:hypothetical protein
MRKRDKVLLGVVFAAMLFGILQGLPDAVGAVTDLFINR